MTQFLARNTRDVDGNVKLALDSVFAGMGVNDNRVFEVVLRKVVTKGEAPHIVIGVSWDV